MKRSEKHDVQGALTSREMDLDLHSAHHGRRSRPLDYWSILLGVICLGLGLSAFIVSAQDKAIEKPVAEKSASSQVHVEKNVRLTFVEKRDLTFDRAGVLEFVHEDGETVEAGKVVARFLSAREKAALAVAQARSLNNAEVLEARAQAELAKIKLDSANKANEEHKARKDKEIEERKAAGKPVTNEPYSLPYNGPYIAELQKSFEAASASVGRAEKENAVNEKGIAQAQADLDLTEIKAPMAGQVTRVYKRSGEGVQAGEKVLQVISTQRIRATVEVPVAVAAHLKKGMPVTVIVDQPESGNAMKTQRHSVTLGSIDPSVIPGAQKVTIWAEIDNTEGKLREGLTSSLEIVLNNTAPAKP